MVTVNMNNIITYRRIVLIYIHIDDERKLMQRIFHFKNELLTRVDKFLIDRLVI